MKKTSVQDVQMAVNTYAAVLFSTIVFFVITIILYFIDYMQWLNIPIIIIISIFAISCVFLVVAFQKKKIAIKTLQKYVDDNKIANVEVNNSTLKLVINSFGRGKLDQKDFVKVLKGKK
ncbi:MAG: hypothetical protein ACRC5R_05280 [Mycoplasmatales bacterium]